MRFVWEQTATWLPLLKKTRGRRQTTTSTLGAMREIYDDLTVFHGGRPLNADAYYREGLQLADHDKLTATARSVFLSGEFPEIDESEFQNAAHRPSGIDNWRTYVSLDRRHCLQDCGHYLIYGSEHICGIAASLSRNGMRDYRQVLKRFGRPTLFTLSLPITMACESDLIEFGELIRDWVPRVRAGRRPAKVAFTFTLRMGLPPGCVLGHEHPDSVKDPLLRMQPHYHCDTSA